MTFRPQHTAVVGATGPTGYHLVTELAGRGWPVRAVSRSREKLEQSFADVDGVEIVPGDALDPSSIHAAVAGCDLVVDAIGLPPERMADHPRTARNLAAAATEQDAKLLQISSYWAFLPHQGEVVSEDHPREGGHEWFRLRREAEDVMLGAGAAVVHLPDFFGPRVHTSVVQMGLQEALDGTSISCIGSADVEREIAWVPDAMRLVADLAEREEAYGTDWAIPGNGVASANDLARLSGEHLGREVGVRGAPVWLIRILALVVPPLRPVRPLAPHYARPVRYDTAKLHGLLGDWELTPLPEAVARTLDHLEEAPQRDARPVRPDGV